MKVAVVVPAYRVKNQILQVLSGIGPEVSQIFVVDDACPEQSGKLVTEQCKDSRVKVIFHERNQGVGGAMATGYQAAAQEGAQIIVKLDGDGQMNPQQIPRLIEPIKKGDADYTKGNRFYTLESLRSMPPLRILGNAVFSFVNKLASGYWNLMDPNNGFVALHANLLPLLRLHRIDKGYFFESDMLFRLNINRAVVREVPMDAVYGDENSSLNLWRVCLEFPSKYGVRFLKRIVYSYFLRDFNACTLEILFGTTLTCFGGVFGAIKWYQGVQAGVPATTGTVMLAGVPVILGFQLFLAAVSFDVMNIPSEPIHPYLE